MKQHQVTQFEYESAKQWTSFTGNPYTISQNPEDKIAGNLGEMFFKKKFPNAKRVAENDKSTDFILNERKIDVKCTLHEYDPKDYFSIHVNAYQKDFKTDFYFFYWFNAKTKTLFELGYISKEEFFIRANFYDVGDKFPNSDKIIKTAIYRLPIKELKPYD